MTDLSTIEFALAEASDAGPVADLRAAVAADLTSRFGTGHWSSSGSAQAVLRDLAVSRVLLAKHEGRPVGTLLLTPRKPWAIDPSYFTKSQTPLYLSDMAVVPALQGRGIGRRCLEEAARMARSWPADAIRLDAYEAAAGAGAFYARCGYREVGRTKYRDAPLIYYEYVLAQE